MYDKNVVDMRFHDSALRHGPLGVARVLGFNHHGGEVFLQGDYATTGKAFDWADELNIKGGEQSLLIYRVFNDKGDQIRSEEEVFASAL